MEEGNHTCTYTCVDRRSASVHLVLVLDSKPYSPTSAYAIVISVSPSLEHLSQLACEAISSRSDPLAVTLTFEQQVMII